MTISESTQMSNIEAKREEILKSLFQRLALSPFRSHFHLREKEKQYVIDKGMPTIQNHARDFIQKRLAPCHPSNDGQQTPTKGHPVFVAQHATGTCCRHCLYKWHKIAPNQELTPNQQRYVVTVIMRWIQKEMAAEKSAALSP